MRLHVALPDIYPRWLIMVLAVLFLGPLAAPLFQASGLPLLVGSGTLANDLLARYICPTPAKSYMLLGFPMAVCARCWGATIGLWAAWWLLRRLQIADCRLQIIAKGRSIEPAFRANRPLWWASSRLNHVAQRCRQGQHVICSAYLAMAWPLRLGLAVGALLLWALEINLWPAAPLPVLLLNGAHGGFWAAMFLPTTLWLLRSKQLS